MESTRLQCVVYLEGACNYRIRESTRPRCARTRERSERKRRVEHSASSGIGASLAQPANYFAVSGLRECLQGLRAHEAKAPELQNVAGHHGVVRRVTDSDEVEVAHHHVELLHLAPHVCQKLLGGVEAARRILGGFDAGIGQAEERDVGGHCFPSPYGHAKGSALLLPPPHLAAESSVTVPSAAME